MPRRLQREAQSAAELGAVEDVDLEELDDLDDELDDESDDETSESDQAPVVGVGTAPSAADPAAVSLSTVGDFVPDEPTS